MSYGYEAANKLISHKCSNGVAQLRQAGLARLGWILLFWTPTGWCSDPFTCCSHLTQTEGAFTTLIPFFFLLWFFDLSAGFERDVRDRSFGWAQGFFWGESSSCRTDEAWLSFLSVKFELTSLSGTLTSDAGLFRLNILLKKNEN